MKLTAQLSEAKPRKPPFVTPLPQDPQWPKRVPRRFWDPISSQRRFFEWLGVQLGVKSMEDWYGVTKSVIVARGGGRLLEKYANSPFAALQASFPEHPWQPWKFTRVSNHFWKDSNNQRTFLEWAGKQLGVKTLDLWYRISQAHLAELGGAVFFRENLAGMLVRCYPSHKWDLEKLGRRLGPIKSSQWKLLLAVQDLFPGSEAYEEYEVEGMVFSSGHQVQLDIYLPKHLLALEYQGQQHYHDIYSLGESWHRLLRDDQKRTLCKRHGITLIEIPYWWDQTVDSLRATIYKARPDLFPGPGRGAVIPSEPPQRSPQRVTLCHGVLWDGKQDLSGWWLSEKIDGVRAYWDGEKMFSKSGIEILAPWSFTDELPPVPLDGELHMGKASLEKLIGCLSSKSHDWAGVKYHIFDLPASKDPYEARMESLKLLKLPSHAEISQPVRFDNQDGVEKYLSSILDAGGEGAVAIEPGSPYFHGRTAKLLKLKPHRDAEVQLVEVLPIGLLCEQANGLRQTIPCPHNILSKPPSIGAIITVKHAGYYSSGMLRHPHFWRERGDVLWERAKGSNQLPEFQAVWTSERNHKDFLAWLGDKLEIKRPEDWYRVKEEDVIKYGGTGFLARYSNHLYWALKRLQPDYEWVPWRFHKVPRNYWTDTANHKRFFDWVWRQLGYKQMSDWYNIQTSEIHWFGGENLLEDHYRGSLVTALKGIYPHHNWQPWRFSKLGKNMSYDWETVKAFMQFVGKELHVKELNDWYKVSLLQIGTIAPTTIVDNNGGLPQLLQKLYPSHEWNPLKWTEVKSSQRMMFLRLKTIFSGDVHEDYLHPELRFETGAPMQFDVFVPGHSLAFEYQGKQHYDHVKVFGPQKMYANRDRQKREACARSGITLIEVPYWWDFGIESLKATITRQRPDIGITSEADPIPDQPNKSNSSHQ